MGQNENESGKISRFGLCFFRTDQIRSIDCDKFSIDES